MNKTERYSASGWVEPFSFSDKDRQALQGLHGLSVECISGIERAVEEERGVADILSGEPGVPEIEAALTVGADAAAKLLEWLLQVDAKTKSVVELSNFKRTNKLLSHYRPIIRELRDSIEIAKNNLPEKKRGRRPAKFPLRLARVIADRIEHDGKHVDATPNGLLCQTLGIALAAIGRQRSRTSDIVTKMLKERGK